MLLQFAFSLRSQQSTYFLVSRDIFAPQFFLIAETVPRDTKEIYLAHILWRFESIIS